MIEPLKDRQNTLHVAHSWGGGLSKWVNDFCRQDIGSNSFQLQSIGRVGVPGIELHLFSATVSEQTDIPLSLTLLKKWTLSAPITATAIYSVSYQIVLEEILETYQISRVIISSLIGHSLDILSFGSVPRIVVCHDYYPFCPAINIYFEGVCSSCRGSHLKDCFDRNVFNRFFPLATAEDWVSIRRSYVDLVTEYNVPLVVPSASVKKNLQLLSPRLRSQANFVEISHGVDAFERSRSAEQRSEASRDLLESVPKASATSRPRVVILGSVDYQKGFYLIREFYQRLARFSDLYFVGSGDIGEAVEQEIGVYVFKSYKRQDLPAIIDNISPDLALLLSVWPETYSYTLSELFMLKVPVVATNLGSFSDRLEDGVNGFLVEPVADCVLAKVEALLGERRADLDRVAENLTQTTHRTVKEMIGDYHRLIAAQLPQPLSKLYPFRESVLLSRQVSLDVNKLARKQSIWKLNRRTAFSERVPLTARFKILNRLKNRFPKAWERIKAPILQIYTRITY